MMKKTISLKVNGGERSVEFDARTTLLDMEGEKIPFSPLKLKVSVEAA
jgi:aerobic-type carbon monoxide dehydrogenase small subunit (CoxS/CutS family)